ncbi:MAG TPA: ROK family protein [Pyrinomonadaceae bacterium]|jgi:glucokinase|nr:ROK family protein [Pyrinomonadaceae bacterium]
MSDVVLAVDLGGTNARMAAVDKDGGVLHLSRRETPSGVTGDQLADLFLEMAGECETATRIKFAAIGIGVPANVTPDGVLHHLPNIPTLEGSDLRAQVSMRFAMPCVLENDATSAAIGEAWLGAAKGIDNWFMITLGTGIGGGVFVDGEPLRGPDGGAGKLGHICVEPDGHSCGCGSHGCIEQYASATALVRMSREAGLEVEDAHALYERFLNGEAIAASVFAKMGRYLGITLAGLVNTFNPEMIVIGGGASAAWDAFVEPLTREVKARAFTESATRAKIVRTALGDDAGILGAARSAFLAISTK